MLKLAAATARFTRKPALLGKTVVVIDGSAGIGLEIARRAQTAGADVILTGRDPERLGLVAPGFVDLPQSASLLGDRLDTRRANLPGVASDDVAALAISVMANTTISSAHDEIDGGRHLLAGAA